MTESAAGYCGAVACYDQWVSARWGLCVFTLHRLVFSASKTFICSEPTARAQSINVRTINKETTNNNNTIPFAFRRNRIRSGSVQCDGAPSGGSRPAEQAHNRGLLERTQHVGEF